MSEVDQEGPVEVVDSGERPRLAIPSTLQSDLLDGFPPLELQSVMSRLTATSLQAGSILLS